MMALDVATQTGYAGLVHGRTLGAVRVVPVPWTREEWPGIEVGRWLLVSPDMNRSSFNMGALLILADQWRRAGSWAMLRTWVGGAWWELARTRSPRAAVTWWPRRSAASVVFDSWVLDDAT